MKNIKGLENYLIFTLRETHKACINQGKTGVEDYIGRLEHSLDMARLAVKFAKKEKCSKEEQDIIYVAGMLHDIGKLNPSKINHDALGANIARIILNNYTHKLTTDFINKVVSCIETHSDKESVNKKYEKINQILIEVDVLEKMSVHRFSYDELNNDKVTVMKHLTKVLNKLSRRKDYLVTKTSKKYYKKMLPEFIYIINKTSFECLL